MRLTPESEYPSIVPETTGADTTFPGKSCIGPCLAWGDRKAALIRYHGGGGGAGTPRPSSTTSKSSIPLNVLRPATPSTPCEPTDQPPATRAVWRSQTLENVGKS